MKIAFTDRELDVRAVFVGRRLRRCGGGSSASGGQVGLRYRAHRAPHARREGLRRAHRRRASLPLPPIDEARSGRPDRFAALALLSEEAFRKVHPLFQVANPLFQLVEFTKA
jgi:hypothetical protein